MSFYLGLKPDIDDLIQVGLFEFSYHVFVTYYDLTYRCVN